MNKLLIVNADDFGLCEEITNGIIKAYRDGIVTSTSVAVNGSYFHKSVEALKDSGIDAGIHLTFIGGEKPVSGHIDGLVDEKGLFLKNYRDIVLRLVSGRFDKKALRKELHEQISILKDAGIDISHIDSHQHLHMAPSVQAMIVDIANEFKIKWIRLTRSRFWDIESIGMNIFALLLKRKAAAHGLGSTHHFAGFEQRGCFNEAALDAVLRNLKKGVTELMVHPGYDASDTYDWGYSWEQELNNLTSDAAKDMLKKRGVVLTNFRELQ